MGIPLWLKQWIFGCGVAVFGIMLRYLSFSDYTSCFKCNEMDNLEIEYDYIVVGSGSAGSIVARRLAEDPNVRILLLEAGSKPMGLLNIPSMGPLLQKTVHDWGYETVSQKQSCLGLNNHASVWPMGKIVGGTGMMNNMVYVRGDPEDFTNWYEGKVNYEYNIDILPYFKKLENFDGGNSDYHHHGSAFIRELPFKTKLSGAILEAARSLNYPILENGVDSQFGFSEPKVTMLHSQRWTPSRRLQDIENDKIILRTRVQVEKVLFKANLEAYGVKYWHFDDHYHARATKGVILSAGVIGTPKILMLSGIGQPSHLESVGIKPKLDLPVGDNLQDHVTTGLDLVLLKEPLGTSLDDVLSLSAVWEYFVKGSGPWATVGCENLAFLKTRPGLTVSDLQFMVLPVGLTTDGGVHLRSLAGISEKSWTDYFSKVEANQTAISILPIVLHPKSKGCVRLKSKNFKDNPLIDPNYLSDDYDLNIILRGINIIKLLIETKAMQDLGASLNPNVFPGCEMYEFDTRKYWECYVRHLTVTSYHPVGTCSLGKVVDFEFKVKGTEKLYVVDGSVLPSLTSGNTNAAIMMMAEKAADLIKFHRFKMRDKKVTMKEFFVSYSFCCDQ